MKTNKIKEDCGGKQNCFSHRNEKRMGKKTMHIEDTSKKEIFHRKLQTDSNMVDKANHLQERLKLVKTVVVGFGNLRSLKIHLEIKDNSIYHGILFKPNLIYYEIGFSRENSYWTQASEINTTR